MIFQTIYLFVQSDFTQEYLRNQITYKSFYAEKQFKEIKKYINKIDEDYRVVSLGIHPSISQYNGFYTLDGYSANYPLKYKYEFRKIISRELDKSEDLKHYYDSWASRVYLFSSELGRKYLYTKDHNKSVDITLNTEQMFHMNCKYIVSAVKINNEKANNIKLLKIFDSNESAWRIYLYKIKDDNKWI